ncbi:hypothetical protein CXB51_024626 [Gossypium anomalum]|uniref:DUF7745 domain-containing protein n=1 Tax=Gossypium anomalum TaxID=47600 RepID=A0A8J5YBE8_9ROSI|nr:hypothetical protein CXB51_024626 [Gossypium anomalum]
MVRFWDPAYQYFTFNQEDMTPTIEEYAALLRIDNIKKKNETSCIPWFSLRDLVLNHPDMLKRVNLFALAIYGLIIFPKVLGHIEVAVVDFFERLKQGINPVPTILAETFRSLSICRRKGEEAYLEKEWPKEVTEEHWVLVFQNLRAEDVTWRAHWIRQSVLLYKVGNQDWVPLLGLWGGVGYAPLMVQRGLAQSEFAFVGEGYMKKVRDTAKSWKRGYMKKVRDTAKSWKRIHLMELALYADTLTQDYDIWIK